MAMDQFPPAFPDDRENPYSAPRAEVGPEKELYGPTAVRPEAGAIFTRAWEVYKERMGLCIGACAVWIIFYVAGQILVAYLQANAGVGGFQPGGPPAAGPPNPSALAVYFISLIVVTLFQWWLTLGLTLFMLRIARGREASMGDLFAGGPYLLRYIGASILYGLIVVGVFAVTIIPGIMGMVVSGRNPAGVIIFALSLVIFFVAAMGIYVRLGLYSSLIVDRDAGVLDSLRLSFEITRGYGLLVFAMMLLSGLVVFLGMIACGVGVIFAFPLSYLLLIVTYVSLVDRSTAVGMETLPELEPL